MEKITLKTILFTEKQYFSTLIACFGVMIIASVISTYKYPKPTIDYIAYYGSNYLMYVALNWIMLGAMVSMFIVLGFLMAERILRSRDYYENFQQEKNK